MKAEVIEKNGTFYISVNGTLLEPNVQFRSFRPRPNVIRDMAKAGVRIMNVFPSGIKCLMGEPYSQFGEFWLGDGVYDFDVIRAQVDQIIENAPDAYISLMMQVDTREWFLREHPECRYSFDHLSEAESYAPWIDAVNRCIRDILAFMDREYPEKVIAVYVCAGATCEWANRVPMLYDPVKEKAFQAWCGDETRRLPVDAELEPGEHGILLDNRSQNAIDYWHFLSELNAKTISTFARTVKAYNPGLLVGLFGAYIVAHMEYVGEKAQNGLVTLLYDNPDIDLVFSPASYFMRGMDNVGGSQVCMSSIHLHHKLYYHEIDETTFLVNDNPFAQKLQEGYHGRQESLEESIMYLRRDTAIPWSELGTYWWFDMFGGWFDHPTMMAEIKKMNDAQTRLYSKPVCGTGEAAYFVDEESIFHCSRHNILHWLSEQPQLMQTGRMGCKVDCFAANDLLYKDFDPDRYRLFIFPDMVAPTEKLRKVIAELRARGACILFVYAPGILSPEGDFDPAGMEALTGIRLKVSTEKLGKTVARPGRWVDGGKDVIFGGEMDKAGVVVVSDEDDKYVFARGEDSGEGQYVVKPRPGGGFDAWVAQGVVPYQLLKALAREAGCFIWQEDGLPVYTNSRMLGIYSHEPGQYAVRVPWTEGELVEMYTDERHPIRAGESITLSFGKNEMKCFLREEDL